jgi:hypothetical protein
MWDMIKRKTYGSTALRLARWNMERHGLNKLFAHRPADAKPRGGKLIILEAGQHWIQAGSDELPKHFCDTPFQRIVDRRPTSHS